MTSNYLKTDWWSISRLATTDIARGINALFFLRESSTSFIDLFFHIDDLIALCTPRDY